MSEEPRDTRNTAGDGDALIWQIWVSTPLNKDAELLTRWSRTSFFAGRSVNPVIEDGGREYVLFRKCGDESSMKTALGAALSNYGFVMLRRCGESVPLDAYAKDVDPKGKSLLGDAATMERTGGMC